MTRSDVQFDNATAIEQKHQQIQPTAELSSKSRFFVENRYSNTAPEKFTFETFDFIIESIIHLNPSIIHRISHIFWIRICINSWSIGPRNTDARRSWEKTWRVFEN